MTPRRAGTLARRDEFSPASITAPPRVPESTARRALLVCEDPERCGILAHEGATRGWAVESFFTVPAANRRIAERRFDVMTVCGDVGEPVLEVARELHAAHPQTPLVVVVDEADTSLRALAARSGASEVVLLAEGPSAIVAAWDAHEAARAGGARILVLAGDAAGHEAVEAAFAAAGCSARVLADGSRLFEEMAAWRPEAVVLDLSAPPPSAWELLHAIHATAEWRQVPVVLIGSRITDDDRRRGSATGADAVVEAAASSAALADAVRGRIRRARLSGAGAARPAEGRPVVPERPRPPSRRTVVLVDGSRGLTEMLRYSCPQAAADCLVFHDGPEAFRFLLNGAAPQRALIVLDLDLPGVDGADGVRRLLRAGGHDYRVVATTGSQIEGEQVRALRAGAVDCLVKPLSLTLFAARMERLLADEDR